MVDGRQPDGLPATPECQTNRAWEPPARLNVGSHHAPQHSRNRNRDKLSENRSLGSGTAMGNLRGCRVWLRPRLPGGPVSSTTRATRQAKAFLQSRWQCLFSHTRHGECRGLVSSDNQEKVPVSKYSRRCDLRQSALGFCCSVRTSRRKYFLYEGCSIIRSRFGLHIGDHLSTGAEKGVRPNCHSDVALASILELRGG